MFATKAITFLQDDDAATVARHVLVAAMGSGVCELQHTRLIADVCE
jgi:hypothetical protein